MYAGIPIYNVIGCMYTPLLTKPRPIKRPRVEEVAPQPAGITQSRAGGPLAKRPRLKESHSGTSSGTRDVPTLSITSSPTLSITSSAAQQSTASKCSHPQSTSSDVPTLSITSSAAQQSATSKCSHPQSTSYAPATQNERSSVRCRIKRRSLRTVNARRRRLYQKRKQTAARLKRRSSGECPDLDLNE